MCWCNLTRPGTPHDPETMINECLLSSDTLQSNPGGGGGGGTTVPGTMPTGYPEQFSSHPGSQQSSESFHYSHNHHSHHQTDYYYSNHDIGHFYPSGTFDSKYPTTSDLYSASGGDSFPTGSTVAHSGGVIVPNYHHQHRQSDQQVYTGTNATSASTTATAAVVAITSGTIRNNLTALQQPHSSNDISDFQDVSGF